jgi:CheY-like chemotaxis protein
MNDEAKQRLFEPFYTTKFIGRGLGMSAVRGIILSHGGALQLSSQQGQGTTFKVYLPVQISEPVEIESTQKVSSGLWQGSGTILLVEDDEQVMSIARTMLRELGFFVIEASNGKDALELYQQNAVDITLVMTDMGMPVMDGYELFSELKKLKPELPILISSGFGDVEITSKIARDEITGLISKPYRFDLLQETVKSVMEGAQLKQALTC